MLRGIFDVRGWGGGLTLTSPYFITIRELYILDSALI